MDLNQALENDIRERAERAQSFYGNQQYQPVGINSASLSDQLSNRADQLIDQANMVADRLRGTADRLLGAVPEDTRELGISAPPCTGQLPGIIDRLDLALEALKRADEQVSRLGRI